MKINIDASRACRKDPTGTEYYSQELIKGFARIDNFNQYILYTGPEPPEELKHLPANFNWKIIKFKYLWTMLRLSWEFVCKKQKEILFVPAHVIPLVAPKKVAVTIHDVAYIKYPQAFSRFSRIYHKFALFLARRKASIVITDSLASKKDLIEIGKIPARKIKVILLGYDSKLYFQESIGRQKPYLYTIGRIEEKKNILNILKAFRILKEKYQIPHQLVFAGRPGYGYQKIKEYWQSLPEGIQKEIKELGYIPKEKMAQLMRGADIFLFPSFFEGFGMPILDAMASGVPVVTSDTSSCPEVAGNAAILVNPYHAEEIAEAVYKINQDKSLRQRLIEKGLAQAKKFSWEKCARETLKTIESLDEKIIKIFNIKISNIYFNEVLKIFKEYIKTGEPRHIATVNPEFMVETQKNLAFKRILQRTDLNLCDGFGLKLFYRQIKEVIPGVDLVWELAKQAAENNWKIYLLGGERGVAKETASRMKLIHPQLKITGVSEGEPIYTKKEVIDDIRAKKPDILLVAYGTPKQEIFLGHNKQKLGVPVMLGVGGSFDFIAGRIPRAPKWLQKLGLEWFYRLCREPRKRFRRILNAIFVFPYLVLTKKC